MSNLRIRRKKLDKQDLEIKNITNLYNTRDFVIKKIIKLLDFWWYEMDTIFMSS